jgi:hypothetical protein
MDQSLAGTPLAPALRFVREWALAFIVVLVVLCLFLWFRPAKQGLSNPTATALSQDSDQFGLSAQNYGYSYAVPSQRIQGAVGGPGASAASQAVLSSPAFGCGTRQPVGDDAWAWQSNVAVDPAIEGAIGSNDSRLSAVMAGAL